MCLNGSRPFLESETFARENLNYSRPLCLLRIHVSEMYVCANVREHSCHFGERFVTLQTSELSFCHLSHPTEGAE